MDNNPLFSPPQSSEENNNPLFPTMQQDPTDVQSAEKYTGKQVDQGYCEQFVSQMTDGKKWGDTAADSFQNQVNAGLGVSDPTLKGAKPGSKIYFAPDAENGYNGHAGILVNDKGDFISANYDKVTVSNLSKWHQAPIGYVPVKN